MVMAAGLGKRMRPLTETTPKPLIEVAGKPLIDHVLERLRAAGVEQRRRQRPLSARRDRGAFARRSHGLDVAISDERDLLLETGGGLVKAAPMIDCDPFLAVNSDNLWIDGPADTVQVAGLALGRRADGRACCCWSRRRGRINHRGLGRFPHGPRRAGSAAAEKRGSRRSCSPASRWSRRRC